MQVKISGSEKHLPRNARLLGNGELLESYLLFDNEMFDGESRWQPAQGISGRPDLPIKPIRASKDVGSTSSKSMSSKTILPFLGNFQGTS